MTLSQLLLLRFLNIILFAAQIIPNEVNTATTPDVNHNSNKTYTISSSGPSGVSVNVKQHHEQQRITHEQVSLYPRFSSQTVQNFFNFLFRPLVQSSLANGCKSWRSARKFRQLYQNWRRIHGYRMDCVR